MSHPNEFRFKADMVGKEVVKVKKYIIEKSPLGPEYDRYDGSYVGEVMKLLKVREDWIEVQTKWGRQVFSREKGGWGDDAAWRLYE